MAKKRDFDPKAPGQQYEEIQNAQRKQGRKRIRTNDKSKQRDKEELKRLADDAAERRRKRSEQ